MKLGPRSKIFMNFWIQKAFGNKLNESLNMVCTEVAAKYFVEGAKSKRKRCIVAAIVSAEKFKYQEIFKTGAGNSYYFEYSFYMGRYLFILKSTQQNSEDEVEQTRHIIECLKSQSLATGQYPAFDIEKCTIF